MEQLKLSYIADGNIAGKTILGKCLAASSKASKDIHMPICDTKIPLLGIHPTEMSTSVH